MLPTRKDPGEAFAVTSKLNEWRRDHSRSSVLIIFTSEKRITIAVMVIFLLM